MNDDAEREEVYKGPPLDAVEERQSNAPAGIEVYDRPASRGPTIGFILALLAVAIIVALIVILLL